MGCVDNPFSQQIDANLGLARLTQMGSKGNQNFYMGDGLKINQAIDQIFCASSTLRFMKQDAARNFAKILKQTWKPSMFSFWAYKSVKFN